jgi:hypothetical protein
MQAEPDILVTAGSDRGIALYDLRSGELVGDLPLPSTTLGNHCHFTWLAMQAEACQAGAACGEHLVSSKPDPGPASHVSIVNLCTVQARRCGSW